MGTVFEMSCQQCLSSVKCLLSFLMVVDMVTDILTIKKWKRGCDSGKLPCYWWGLGVFIFLLPTVAATIFFIWHGGSRFTSYICTLLAGPLYVIWAPLVNIVYHFLVCLKGRDQLNNKDVFPSTFIVLPFINLFEVVFESLPQMVIQWYFIYYHLAAGEDSDIFEHGGYGLESWRFAIFSAVISTLSVVYGAYRGVKGAVTTKCLTFEGML